MGDFADRLKVSYHYLRTVRRPLDLQQPKTFTEKVQVAKLTWRSPRMVALADKVEAKKVVAASLGPEWVTPTLYAGAALPPRSDRTWAVPHVIKCNHRSGGNHFVRSGDPDWGPIERSVARQLSKGYGRRLAEWVYSQIKPQVLVEPYIGNPEVPPDYKLHLFGGKFAFTLVNWDRFFGRRNAARHLRPCLEAPAFRHEQRWRLPGRGRTAATCFLRGHDRRSGNAGAGLSVRSRRPVRNRRSAPLR